ncbi:GDSL lipase/esterase, partial [Blyttiomyces helicus]
CDSAHFVFPAKSTKIAVFGDSLSDNGNTFKATHGAMPPSPFYHGGRFSNGPVWVEHLANTIPSAKLVDLAFGGATSSSKLIGAQFGRVAAPEIPGALEQAHKWVSSVGGRKNVHPKSTLATLWVGANDYFNAEAAGRHDIDPCAVVDRIMDTIDVLRRTGVINFLIFDQPPVSNRIPFWSHNILLAQRIGALAKQHPGLRLVRMEMVGIFEEIVKDRARFGLDMPIELVTSPCLNQTTNPWTECQDSIHLLWDRVHPTTKVHKIIGNLAYDALVKEGLLSA